MAIRTKESCDICELEYGEESEKARIFKETDCPAYPQLIWTYYKKGYQILQNRDTGQPILHHGYQGNVNRLEFCDEHASQFNALLKAFALKDTKLATVLDDIHREDQKIWDAKQKSKKAEFAKLIKKESESADRD